MKFCQFLFNFNKFILIVYSLGDFNTYFFVLFPFFCFCRFEFEIKLWVFCWEKEPIGVRNMDSETMISSAEGERSNPGLKCHPAVVTCFLITPYLVERCVKELYGLNIVIICKHMGRTIDDWLYNVHLLKTLALCFPFCLSAPLNFHLLVSCLL